MVAARLSFLASVRFVAQAPLHRRLPY